DNAWDADASAVHVRLPDSLAETMANADIVISDDGSGMTEDEVRSIYLRIASDRLSRSKDARTAGKWRLVKGRKGIGKFAGLAAAHKMTIETRARGRLTRVVIEKAWLLEANLDHDLEAIDLPIEATDTGDELHGTTVTLTDLDQQKALPNPETLRRLLVREYSRENGFDIFINDEPLHVADLGGEPQQHVFDHPEIGRVSVSWTVTDRPM